MKNLKPYNGSAYSEYTDSVNRKNNSIEKRRLQSIKPFVKTSYEDYKSKFDENTLYLMKRDSVFNSSKDILLSLYDFQNRTIRNIRENIKNQQIITIQTTCQNCTIDSVESMDHVLPKTTFPELAINAYNLFPCCSRCNGYKSKLESSAGDKKFLNLFLDQLPEIQYLFVSIFKSYDGSLDYKYYLQNIDEKIDPSLFTTIQNHFQNLHLFDRMRDSARTYLSAFIASIKPHLKRNSINYIKKRPLRILMMKERLTDLIIGNAL